MIVGIGIRGYRSFWGSEVQRIGPMSNIHLVVGQNNSGKSNILRAAQTFLPTLSTKALSPTGADIPVGTAVTTAFTLAVCIDNTSELLNLEQARDQSTLARLIALADDSETSNSIAVNLWIELKPAGRSYTVNSEQVERIYDRSRLSGVASDDVRWDRHLRFLCHAATGKNVADSVQAITLIFDKLISLLNSLQVQTISAFRQIREASGDDLQLDHSGVGLIKRLALLENPLAANYDQDLTQWRRINSFVKKVLEDESAQLRIPATQTNILVQMQGRTLDLENLGTGIHEVIILAAAATVLDDHLVCIEEPEVHLHPLLQRRLLSYLRTQTQNRYLIATHSAHLLDSSLASFSHIQLSDNGSRTTPATSPREVAEIVRDLGFRASDIVQSNAIIWVEGPSDRVYIRAWLAAWDSELTEGIHFTVMFYGGRLLSHLTASEQDLDAFINLRRINQNMVIVIDSDKKTENTRINPTKRRIKSAFSDKSQDGFAWVTRGREIENYIPVDHFKEAFESSHPSASATWNGSQYGDAFDSTPNVKQPNKVKIAQKIAQKWTQTTAHPFGLDENIRQLVHFIRRSNGLDPKNFVGRPASYKAKPVA